MNNTELILAIASITLLMLFLVAAIVIVIFISGRQRLKQQMEMAENKLTFEKELRQVETEVSEQILGQLAQELHDNIGQMLTAVHIHLENQMLDHPELKEDFKPMETYLSDVSQQLRALSRTLNNDYIGHIGLLASIDAELKRIKALRRFEVHWQPVTGISNLDKNQELMIFRVFQEIIQNSLRHSMAKNAYVEINNAAGSFELKIEDDGKGFDLENTLKSDKASGLRNIFKRAQWAGLNCTVESSPGKGCRIVMKKIPVMESKV
jgi:signal transduction histidine kinase